jgi:hypothetical protein
MGASCSSVNNLIGSSYGAGKFTSITTINTMPRWGVDNHVILPFRVPDFITQNEKFVNY